MQKEAIELVKDSWNRLAPAAREMAALFYQNLFLLDASARQLFKGDMEQQGRKLMQMMGVAVFGLNDLEGLAPKIEDLGRRHASFGVQESHYATVGSAFLKTLEQSLGSEFTPALRAAWTQVYWVLANTMIAGTRRSVQQGNRQT